MCVIIEFHILTFTGIRKLYLKFKFLLIRKLYPNKSFAVWSANPLSIALPDYASDYNRSRYIIITHKLHSAVTIDIPVSYDLKKKFSDFELYVLNEKN